MTETAQEAARRLSAQWIAKGYRPTGLHRYTCADGSESHCRIRLKHPVTGEKVIRPIHADGERYKLGEPTFGGRLKPMYRLHEVAAANPVVPVWWVEGEQKVDRLAGLGLLATTAGGATSDDGCDFEPLRGRCVIVWPDNDDPGRQHGERVAAKLKAIGCAVELINLAPLELAEHGDVIDYLSAHPNATADDLMALARLPITPSVSAGDGAAPRVELQRADNVAIEPVRWLWNGWLAAGKLHILAGPPGTGKTSISLSLAATITCGGRWPDGSHAEVGEVLIWSGEDDPADTLVPRLKAAGAELSRVHFVGQVRDQRGPRPFDPALDMAALLEAIRGMTSLRLLILDPIVNAIASDSNKNAEVRRALAPVVDLAASFGVAVLGVSHFSKGSQNRDPVERVTGSLAFGALARVVLAAVRAKTENGPDRRLLARAKSNIGKDDGGFAYSLEQVNIGQGIEASRVMWGPAIEGSARELLADAEVKEGGALHDAAHWLRELLKGGPVPADAVVLAAEASGISRSTLNRAKKLVGAKSTKDKFRSHWSWCLPEGDQEDAEDAQDQVVGAFGNPEDLRNGSALGDAEVF
jgi:putative DNA primase/helicase